MRAIKTMVMLLGLTSWALSGYSATSLPFETNFNDVALGGDLPLNTAWSYVIAPKGTNGAPEGAAAIYSADQFTVNVSGADPIVWWFSYAKVRAHSTEPTMVATDAAAFYVNTAGQLMASSNTEFVAVASNVPTNSWVKFGVRLDYDNNVWDLYMANPHTATLEKRNGTPLGFKNDALTGIAAVEVSGETYLDAISMEATTVAINPLVESPDNVTEAPLIQVSDASAVSLRYFGLTGNLLGPLGASLGTLFNAGDTITFWNGVFATRTWDGTDWTGGDFTITPTTGMFIDRTGSGTSGTVAYSQTYSHRDAPAATPISTGWNLLAIPYTASSTPISSSLLPTGLNDRVFLRSTTGWSISRFNGTSWTPNITLPSGRTFWLYRNGGATTWDAKSLPLN